jgi:hypothetical protein
MKTDRNSEMRAVLFDVDGTLADNERNGHRLAFNATFVMKLSSGTGKSRSCLLLTGYCRINALPVTSYSCPEAYSFEGRRAS